MASTISETAKLIQLDKECVWHPFTQMKTAPNPLTVKSAKGIYLYDYDENQIIDGISSWWVNLHGHSHPYMIEKIKEQIDVLQHVSFGGITHAPAVNLASRLLEILPNNLKKIFFNDNGSTAVETALKMCFQYWHNKNPGTTRKKVISLNSSYHGDTFGAMSSAGKNFFNKPFWKHLFEIDSIDFPKIGEEERSLNQMKALLEKELPACFIFEPLILGAGGMITYSKEGLNQLLKLCKEYNVLTIADEVMTGFGRLETLFACEQLKYQSDIMCLSKGITGGYLTLGATACTDEIYNAFLGDSLSQALLHGHTYTANPLACASGLASLDLLLSPQCFLQRQLVTYKHKGFVQQWKAHPKLKRCESIGTILIVEYYLNEKTSYFQTFRDKLYDYFLKKGIYFRPLGSVLYVMTPYCIQESELDYIYDCIIQTLEGDL